MIHHNRMQHEENSTDNLEEKSRTAKKNIDRELQKTGERLLALNQSQLLSLDIPAELKEAATEAQKIRSHQARRRQIQYIGVLMRSFDTTPLLKSLELIEAGISTGEKKQSEKTIWFTRLVEGTEGDINALVEKYPLVDRQKLRQLIRNIRKETNATNNSKSKKNLKLYLEELL